MPVAASDMKLIEATTMPTSDSTSSVGGAIDGGDTEISSATVGQVHYTMASNASGGGDKVRYSKIFDKNDHATDTVNNYVVWIENAIDTLGTANTLSFQSASSSDDDTKEMFIQGFSSGGAAQSEAVEMDGTTQVTSSLSYTGRVRCILRLVSTGATSNAAGDIDIEFDSSTVGTIPAGLYSATGEIDIALASALDDSATIADPTTAPSGPSFTRPRTQAGGLTTDGGTGTIEAQEAQGIWSRWTLPELMLPYSTIQCSIVGYGEPA